jgi:hypothetical protein
VSKKRKRGKSEGVEEKRKEKGKEQSDGKKRKREADDKEKEMEESMDWEEFMVHRVIRVDSGMKVANRDLVELRSELAELQEETVGNFEGLQKELKTLREENAGFQREMGVIIEENRATGVWIWGILCRLEEKLEVEARNEPEGLDTEKKKDGEANEESEEEEEEKRPETEESRVEDVVRVAEDKEKGDGDVEMAAVE